MLDISIQICIMDLRAGDIKLPLYNMVSQNLIIDGVGLLINSIKDNAI